MRIPRNPTLIRRLRLQRLDRLRNLGLFLAASLHSVSVRCGRKGCHCAQGPGHPSSYLTLKRKAKTQTVYVPKDKLAEVRQWVEEYHKLKSWTREISDLGLGLLRAEARIRRAQRKRQKS